MTFGPWETIPRPIENSAVYREAARIFERCDAGKPTAYDMTHLLFVRQMVLRRRFTDQPGARQIDGGTP